jgi:hypothetical protein
MALAPDDLKQLARVDIGKDFSVEKITQLG